MNALDALSTTELFKKDGASAGALGFIGGQGSALQAVWHAAILKLRGVPLWPPKVYRLVGGNQTLTDTFAARLGDRLRLESPVTRHRARASGVRVSYRERGETRRLEADYLVSAISAVMLRAIPVSPAWPETKAFALGNVPYYFDSRVIFQTRSKFWAKDGVSPNMEINEDALQHVWSTCDEVASARGLLVGTATGAGSPDAALASYRKHYTGPSEDIEKAQVHVWIKNPWASACETTAYPVGSLARFWPALFEPVGRVHFVGAYADNLNWGIRKPRPGRPIASPKPSLSGPEAAGGSTRQHANPQVRREGPTMSLITLRVNGRSHTLDTDPATPLLYVLSDDLALRGPRFGCGLGQCGACTVLVKGQAIRSCMTPVQAVAGAEVTTLEGLGTSERPHPIQQAFIDEQASQCGFCLSGVILSAKALIDQKPKATDDDIRQALSGVLCRCFGHNRMLAAIRRYADGRTA